MQKQGRDATLAGFPLSKRDRKRFTPPPCIGHPGSLPTRPARAAWGKRPGVDSRRLLGSEWAAARSARGAPNLWTLGASPTRSARAAWGERPGVDYRRLLGSECAATRSARGAPNLGILGASPTRSARAACGERPWASSRRLLGLGWAASRSARGAPSLRILGTLGAFPLVPLEPLGGKGRE